MKNILLLILVIVIYGKSNSQICNPVRSYGNASSCDEDCNNNPYAGEYDSLIIPLKLHSSILNTGVNLNNYSSLLQDVNLQFSSNYIPIQFSVIVIDDTHSTIFNDYCSYNESGGSCDCSIFGGTSYYETRDIALLNPSLLNIFVFEGIYFEETTSNQPCDQNDPNNYEQGVLGNAFFPINDDPNGSNNYALINNDVFNNGNGKALAHELGHLLGLYHTFEMGIFDIPQCDTQDGIFDTPPDSDGTSGSVSNNLMDYGSQNTIIDITPCQKSKILDVLFTCRNNLCSNPTQPDVQTTDGLSAFQLNYTRDDQLDTLVSVLDNITGTNSGNFALFKLRDETGLIIDTWFADSLDLNTVFDGANHPNYGTFTIEAIDSSLYNPNCKSSPTIIDIFIDPCNNDSICDSEEECEDCNDCLVDLDNGLVAYYPFNGNANDESGNGHDGSVNGASLTTDRFGTTNSCYEFDGVDDYMILSDDVRAMGIIDNNSHSISIWFKSYSLNWSSILADWDANSTSNTNNDCCDDNFDIHFYVDHQTNKLAVGIKHQNQEFSFFSSESMVSDKWYHYVQTKDQQNLNIYLDGSLIGSIDVPTDPYIGTSKLFLGTLDINLPADPFFHGKLDDLRIYDRTLNCDEIQALYHTNCWEEQIDLENGLVAYYPFNGNANDESGNGNNPTTVNASLAEDRFGNIDAAYEFDGINDFIVYGDIMDLGSMDFSISTWINLNSLNSNKIINKGLTAVGSPANAGYGLRNGYNFPQELEVHVGDANGIIVNSNFSQTITNHWYHLVSVREGTNLLFYIDGQIASTANTGTIFNTNTNIPFAIGALHRGIHGTVDEFFHGKIDDIRIYNRTLNCNEIDSLYNEGCIQHKLIENQVFSMDTTFFARNLIELDNVTVNSPFELTLRSPEVLIENNCEIDQGARLTVINEDGCIQN